MLLRSQWILPMAFLALAGLPAARVHAQDAASSNSMPDPYHWDRSWVPKFDGDRKWGSSAGVGIDAQGHIWIAERCGTNILGCASQTIDPIVETDASGKILKMFGGGLFIEPHGLTIDKQGSIWVTDVGIKDGKGNQVFKFSPDGKILMTLGKAGVKGRDHDTFNPTAVAIAPNGDIFVSDGHSARDANDRIMKFDKNGKYLMEWGQKGTGPGEFDIPHCLAFDSKGRLFVCDRSNNRIQIFDQNGKFIAEWKQFGRPGGISIDKKDMIYVAGEDGIRIGSAKDGKVKYFVPFVPGPPPIGSEGIATDSKGNIYTAGYVTQTFPEKRYVK